MKRIIIISIIGIAVTILANAMDIKVNAKDSKDEIIQKIINAAMADSSAWNRLAYMCDTYGPRLAGSEGLNKALEWVYQEMKKDGFSNVVKEKVMVPKWVRGKEKCELLEPRSDILPIAGIGGSIGTPKEGITAPILVVHSFDDLKAKADQAKGKIVVFNFPWVNYGVNVQYRFRGAFAAAEAGAVASLFRSASPVGFRNPHTGMMGQYPDTLPKIPHAALSMEDVNMLERLHDTGHNPVIRLYMEAQTMPDAESYNVMSEITGTESPKDIIAMGGHSDSWDVGTGAHDDGGGMIATWQALKILKSIGIQPKKTIRAVMWVNEENGVRGGKAYAEAHKDEKHSLVFEFDSGVFPPSGIGFTSSDSTLFDKVKTFEPYLKKVGDITVNKGGGGVDIGPMMKLGINGMSLSTKDDGKYFWFHHSPSDTPDNVNPEDLNKCVAAIAVAIYLYSELP